MANLDHLTLLNQGIAVWNSWRTNNPTIKAYLEKADLSGANLEWADLSRADLSRANLSGAYLSKAYLRDADLSEADLSEANLSRADLSRADLSKANFSTANLYRADLSGANLEKADLSGANLEWADLSGANLSGANLSGANLSEAFLMRTSLTKVNVNGTDFGKSWLAETVFANVNLAEAKNLDACQHLGPSILDFRTVQQSGSLPLAFLRGCGLSDLLIDYLPSLLNQPLQYYSCFISYSSKDDDFAKRLHADLQSKGLRCWFAPEDIKGGQKLHEQIDEAIRAHEKLLLVLSEHSINSEWVKTEIAKARKREVREKRKVLFPIRLVDFETIKQWECFDADTGKDSAKEIREFFIPDFSNWKNHDAYQQAFDRLLQDLKPELEHKPVK